MNNNLVELQSMHKELRVEIAKDRPVKEIVGITPEVDAQLREMGIRTVGELSNAKSERLITGGDIDASTANNIIEDAKIKLNF